jgi:uncharacterized phage-associated protein
MDRIYDAKEIAEWFLNYVRFLNAAEDEEMPSNLKLQKLLYYAQGTSLALTGQPLFSNPIVRWAHGPAVEEVYRLYGKYQSRPIEYDEEYQVSIDTETEEMLKSVYDAFGQYSAWGLRRLVLQEDPWIQTAANAEIPLESIKTYFEEHYVE